MKKLAYIVLIAILVIVAFFVGSHSTSPVVAQDATPTKIHYALAQMKETTPFINSYDAIHGATITLNGSVLTLPKDMTVQVEYPANPQGYYKLGALTYAKIFSMYPSLNNHMDLVPFGALWIPAQVVNVLDTGATVTPTLSPSVETPVITETPVTGKGWRIIIHEFQIDIVPLP